MKTTDNSKHTTKFSRAEQAWLMKEIAERYFKGAYQSEIAKQLSEEKPDKSITQQLVSYYLKKLHGIWVEEATVKIDELKARELKKIDNLERTYWSAWERSLKPQKLKESEKEGDKVTASVKEYDSLGDHKFLDGVQWCIKQRREILGLDAPKKFSGSMIDYTILWDTVDKQQALRIRSGEDPLVVLRPDQFK